MFTTLQIEQTLTNEEYLNIISLINGYIKQNDGKRIPGMSFRTLFKPRIKNRAEFSTYTILDILKVKDVVDDVAASLSSENVELGYLWFVMYERLSINRRFEKKLNQIMYIRTNDLLSRIPVSQEDTRADFRKYSYAVHGVHNRILSEFPIRPWCRCTEYYHVRFLFKRNILSNTKKSRILHEEAERMREEAERMREEEKRRKEAELKKAKEEEEEKRRKEVEHIFSIKDVEELKKSQYLTAAQMKVIGFSYREAKVKPRKYMSVDMGQKTVAFYRNPYTDEEYEERKRQYEKMIKEEAKRKKEGPVKYICYCTLKSRWGAKLIEKFYPEPDKTLNNPYYKCAAPMKLYDISKVERIETYKRFIKFKAGLKRQKKVRQSTPQQSSPSVAEEVP